MFYIFRVGSDYPGGAPCR